MTIYGVIYIIYFEFSFISFITIINLNLNCLNITTFYDKSRLENITNDYIVKEFTHRAPRRLDFGETIIDSGSFCLSFICHIQKYYYSSVFTLIKEAFSF